MKRAFSLGVAVLVALPLFAACSRDKVSPGDARLDPNGIVEVQRPGGQWKPIKETKTIRAGDHVRVLSGDADLRLATAELAMRSGSELVVGLQPELLRGDLLVVPDSQTQLLLKSAGTEFSVAGAAKLTRSFAVTAGSYMGLISVRSAGSVSVVPALRQATVASLGQEVPTTAEPLKYQDKDPWDRRFLAEAIDLGKELQARSEAGNNQFRGEGTTAGFYRLLMPELESVREFDERLIDSARPPGEHLVGAGIALAGRQGGFAQRWERIFRFRTEGATWGLVAFDQQVHKVPGLVKKIDDALASAGLPASPGRVALPRTRTTTRTPTTTTTTTTQQPRTSDTTTPPPTTPPPTTPPTTTTLLPVPLPIDPGDGGGNSGPISGILDPIVGGITGGR